MAYTPQVWTDGSAGGTPLSAARLTVMETGIEDADTRLGVLETTGGSIGPQGETGPQGAPGVDGDDGATGPAGLTPDTTGQYRLMDFGTVDLTGATDATAVLNAALAAMYAGGGGTLIFPSGRILITGQIVIPNDGGGVPAGTAAKQPSVVWQGQGGFHTGQISPVLGGTRLLMRYQDATYNMAKVVTRGLGRLAVRDITFEDDTAAATTPFIFTTCTTLLVHACAFVGALAATPAQDAIVLGGTKKQYVELIYDDFDSAFQGYGTIISSCYFNNIRRAVFGRSYCNGTVVKDGWYDKGCGTNLTNGGCIEFNAGLDTNVPIASSDTCAANVVTGNTMNGIKGYAHQVKLTGAYLTNVAFNGGFDQGHNTSYVSLVGCYSFVDNGAVTRTTIATIAIGNMMSGVNKPQIYEDTASLNKNTTIGAESSVWNAQSLFRALVTARQRMTFQDDDPAWVANTNRFLEAIRPASYGADPSGVAWRLFGSGRVEVRPLDGGWHTRYSTVANVVHSEVLSYGKDWNGSNQPLTMRAGGTTSQPLNFKAYSHKFWDYNIGASGTVRMTIGAAIDGFALGAASDITVQRDATNSLAVNRPVKTLAVATGSRPTPAAAGVGAQIFDTTLSLPIWSTGTTWVNAAGTTV